MELKDRLVAAMRSVDIDPANNDKVRKLAGKIDVTYQGLRKLIAGESKAMLAVTNSKLAHELGVDPDWLATGKGDMHSRRVWPFIDLSPSDWNRILPAVREASEKGLLSAVPVPPKPAIVSVTPEEGGPIASVQNADKAVRNSRSKAADERNKNR